MMDEQFELLLIECLDELQAGVPIERLLARYPSEAEALKPILETAYALQDVVVAPTSAARVASRRLFLNQAATLRPAQGRLAFRLATFIVAAFVCLLIGSGSIIASAAALPGDTLYGVKQTVEQARLSLASDRTSVEREIDATRRSEVHQLINAGRIADVRFRGPIDQIGNDTLQIAGLTVMISPATQLIGQPILGRIAQVDGQVRGDRVDARQIMIQNEPADLIPTATALPSPTATALPTATATATATALPSPTATATSMPTLTATALPTLPPTQQPTRAPTATPKPPEPPTAMPEPTLLPSPTGDDNGNDNGGNDNGGDNSGNDNGGDNSGNDNGGDNGGNDNGGDNGGDSNDNGTDSNSNDGKIDDSGSNSNSDANDNSGGDNGNSGGDNGNSNDENKDDNNNTKP